MAGLEATIIPSAKLGFMQRWVLSLWETQEARDQKYEAHLRAAAEGAAARKLMTALPHTDVVAHHTTPAMTSRYLGEKARNETKPRGLSYIMKEYGA